MNSPDAVALAFYQGLGWGKNVEANFLCALGITGAAGGGQSHSILFQAATIASVRFGPARSGPMRRPGLASGKCRIWIHWNSHTMQCYDRLNMTGTVE